MTTWDSEAEVYPDRLRLYVSGPMTGRPGHNAAAFDAATARLRALGHDVINPAEETIRRYGSWEAAAQHPWAAHLLWDLRMIAEGADPASTAGPVDMVVVLPDWESSPGASTEVEWARKLGVTIVDEQLEPVDQAPTRRDVVTAASGAMKADGGKPRLDLVPYLPTLEAAKVLTFGAQKYDDHNWRKGFPFSRIKSSLDRHVGAWWNGEDLDPETGISHLAHARCNIDFLLEFTLTGTGTDDRYKR